MNIIILLNCQNLQDIPKAIKELGKVVEEDIAIMGNKANTIGTIGGEDFLRSDFDYQIQQSNFQSIGEFACFFK